jgi:hypothetical protein
MKYRTQGRDSKDTKAKRYKKKASQKIQGGGKAKRYKERESQKVQIQDYVSKSH